MSSSLAATIQALAKERGMSITALADKIGVNRKTLYAALHGNPRLSNLQRIADGLGVRLSDVIALSEDVEEATEGKCQKCGGTGMTDSGGVQPWGEPILIPCDCER